MTSTNPFTYVSSINDKVPIPLGKDYNQFLSNRAFSYHIDSVLLVNELNMHQGIPDSAHYAFLMEVLPKKKRFAKWAKPDNQTAAALISRYFQISIHKAYEIAHLYSEQELQQISDLVKEKEEE